MLVVLTLLCLTVVTSLELPRGVPLSKSPFYRVGRTFSCLNGAATIPWHKVNDNYCDCLDGSDEPGTSACDGGVFFCRDVQYKVSAIRSAFVNDGVCDCCDGSDEYDGRTMCTSTCGILAAAIEQARSTMKGEIERGRQLFKDYVEQLKIRREKAAEQLASSEAESKSDESHSNGSEPSPSDTLSDFETPGTASPETVLEVPADSGKPNDESNETDPSTDEEHGDVPPDDDSAGHSTTPPTSTPAPLVVDYGQGGAFQMLDDLGCLEFSDQQYTYELCGLKEVYQKNVGQSGHGTSLGRWSRWLSDDRDPLEPNPYGIMLYSDGLGCWNGPARSTKVYVRCSDANRIISVTEPSRCEYVMQLLTPAACSEEAEVLFKRIYPD